MSNGIISQQLAEIEYMGKLAIAMNKALVEADVEIIYLQEPVVCQTLMNWLNASIVGLSADSHELNVHKTKLPMAKKVLVSSKRIDTSWFIRLKYVSDKERIELIQLIRVSAISAWMEYAKTQTPGTFLTKMAEQYPSVCSEAGFNRAYIDAAIMHQLSQHHHLYSYVQ